MSLQISPNQLTTPQMNGLLQLNQAADAGNDKDGGELRKAFDSFVGQTFYGQMIKSLHKMQNKPAYFYGGRAEEAFQQQLDQTWTEQMSKATAHTFTGPMFDLFSLSRS
jgi:flagellar protein FlgJ